MIINMLGLLTVKDEEGRHQNVYEILADELSGSVHALALHLYTPGEWQTRHGAIPDSPDCRGGSKSG